MASFWGKRRYSAYVKMYFFLRRLNVLRKEFLVRNTPEMRRQRKPFIAHLRRDEQFERRFTDRHKRTTIAAERATVMNKARECFLHPLVISQMKLDTRFTL